MQHVQPVLSWTLRDFVCSRCCCSNSFFEASNKKKKKKRMQHWQKALDLQLCKITPFLSPSLCPHTQLPAVPRLPDWAGYPEFSPTLALRTEGQTKTRDKSHVSVLQISQFSIRHSPWEKCRKERAEGTQILLVELLKMLTNRSYESQRNYKSWTLPACLNWRL